MATANAINANSQGTIYYDGTASFSGIDGSTSGKVLTSNGTGVAPSFQIVSASGAVTTIKGNDAVSEVPLAGVFNIVGTGSITSVGSANTETIQLTGLTNHSLLIGAGTATITKLGPTATAGQILQSAGSSADPAFSTATYPSTAGTSGKILISDGTNIISSTPTYPNSASSTGTILRANGTNWVATTATYPTTTTINQILYSSAANVISGLVTANSAFLTTTSGGVPQLATSPTASGTITAGVNFVSTAGNLVLPVTSATVGQIQQNSVSFMHSFGTSSTYLGAQAGSLSNTGSGNTGVGYNSLLNVTSAQETTCVGAFSCGTGVVSGTGCTYVGYGCGYQTTSGSYNTGIGDSSLRNVLTGGYNSAIGYNAGQQYTGSESSNVMIGNAGVTGESNVMRLGTNGSGNGQVSSCYVAGVTGVTVTGTAVLCSATGQFGTIVSSERYKENIELMSEDISVLNLQPIKFNYKEDKTKSKQYGLLAEDVNRDFPYLCFYDSENRPESVKYHELCTFLLHEVRKLAKRVQDLEIR